MERKRPTYREDDYAFGHRMLTLRSALGLTQAGLAAQVAVSRRSVADWEAGRKYPTAAHLKHVIALAVAQHAFPGGREAEDIRALWRAAHQKVLLDDVWLSSLLAGGHPPPAPAMPGSAPDGSASGDATWSEPHRGRPITALAAAAGSVDDSTEPGTAWLRSPTRGHAGAPNAPLAGPATITLPSQATSFVGRQAELATLAQLLAVPNCRLLTLLGPGGIGKTRLAIQAAADQTARFADGVAFVALAAVQTPDHLASTIGTAIGLAPADGADHSAHLIAYLRPRCMLLVLDNFEHVLAGADLVAELLANVPHLTLLVTSRERLNLQAEWLFDVGGLSYPPPASHGSALGSQTRPDGYSAIALFVQRARQVQPALALDAATMVAITDICRQLAGMPLAIELAAAGVRALSPAALEQQLRASLDPLVTTLRDVPPRHRSLRAVFDHSWHVLDAQERVLFSRLAVFRGGWTAAAAMEVAGHTLATLTALVDKSLVRWSGAAGTQEPRFTMLEPIREYALEQLAALGAAPQLQRAHAGYYLEQAQALAAQWGTATFDRAIAQLRHEYDNMRAALTWARDNGDSLLGLRLAEALWQFWRSYGYISEGRAWLEQFLATTARSSDPSVRVARQNGLHAAAWLASDQHDYAQAAQFFIASMTLRRMGGETASESDVLLNAARQARAAGEYTRATALLEQALAWHRAQGHDQAPDTIPLAPAVQAFGQALRELGLVLREQGDFARAGALFAESLAFHRAVGDRACVALALMGFADIARDQGDAAQVRRYGEEALVMLRALGMQWAIGFVLNTLALGAYYERDLVGAMARITESETIFRGLQATGSLSEVLVTLGKLLRAQGNLPAAAQATMEAVRSAEAVGPRVFVAAALEVLAGVAMDQGQAERSVRLLAAASALRQQMGAPVWPADRAAVDAALATSRTILGEADVATAWTAAQSLPIEQLLDPLDMTAASNLTPSTSRTARNKTLAT